MFSTFNLLVKTLTFLIFLNFICEKLFVTVAYFTLLTEVAETFGAMLATAMLTNFMVLSTSVTHSFTLTVATLVTSPVPQILSFGLVAKLHTLHSHVV
jgi:hypothetical protein